MLPDRLRRPRIAPLPIETWDAEMRATIDRPGGFGRVLNVMATLAHHPDLFRGWSVLANHLLFKSTLGARDREILILRVAWLTDCAYEWGQHLAIAAAEARFGEAEFEAVAAGAGAPLWAPAERALIRAADQLYADAFVDDATWSALAAHYDERQCLDIVFTAGNYILLAMALNTFGVQLDMGFAGFRGDLPRNQRGPAPDLPAMAVRCPQPRLAPLPEAEASDAQRELLVKARGHLASVNVVETVVRHPDLLRRWLPFFNHCLHKSTLSPRDREILILRIGRLCGAEYEWAQHVPFAERAGLSAAEIAGIAEGAGAAVWRGDPERALIEAADQLHRFTMIDDPLWARLAERYDTRRLMDVVFTVGQYRLVSAALNTLCVPLDPYLKPFGTSGRPMARADG
jgi:alkylhydroperoxidase family enzyme